MTILSVFRSRLKVKIFKNKVIFLAFGNPSTRNPEPGYASSYAATPPSTPQTPALVPTAPLGSSATMPPAPTVGAAAMSEQPPRPLVLMVADESGAPRRAAVSPTRHLPGSKLSGTYLNEFGLGCIHHAGGFYRRLPDVFLPKGV